MMYIETAVREPFEHFARQLQERFTAFVEKIPYYFYALTIRSILVEVTDFSDVNAAIQQASQRIAEIIEQIDAYFADNVVMNADLRNALDQDAVLVTSHWKNLVTTFPAGTPFG